MGFNEDFIGLGGGFVGFGGGFVGFGGGFVGFGGGFVGFGGGFVGFGVRPLVGLRYESGVRWWWLILSIKTEIKSSIIQLIHTTQSHAIQ